MNFLGLGPGELILILGLALVVVGPAKLPEIASQIGKAIRDFRQSTSEITSEFQRSFSLDEPEPAAPPVGPAEVLATHGAAAAEEGATEPPLADASEWHWETSGSAQPSMSASLPEPSFWDWDTKPPAEQAPASTVPSAPIRGWEWDEPSPAAAATVAATETALSEAPVAAATNGAATLEQIASNGITPLDEGTDSVPAAQAPQPASKSEA
jgi:sec-independent protein translocase protein TatA